MKPVTISLAAGGGFIVEIPSETVEGSHHVTIPATLTGLSVLRKVLQERQRAKQMIGMNGAPVQSMVDAWLAAERKELEEQKKIRPDILAELDIEGLDL